MTTIMREELTTIDGCWWQKSHFPLRTQLLMGYSHLGERPHNHTYIGYTNRTQELPLMTKRAEEMNLGGSGSQESELEGGSDRWM